jgi:hypothetical protein
LIHSITFTLRPRKKEQDTKIELVLDSVNNKYNS